MQISLSGLYCTVLAQIGAKFSFTLLYIVGLDLPEEIPMPMVIGTKVTAKVHPEGDGLNLFTGTVDAVDNVNNAYRINFDR